MGYMSEVAITVPINAFKELVAKAKAENLDAYELIKYGDIYQTDKYTTIHFDSVKWYEDYEEVKFINSFIRNVPHVFNRIGEAFDDIESNDGNITDYSIFECINITRSLDVANAGELISIDGNGDEIIAVEGNGWDETDGCYQQAV